MTDNSKNLNSQIIVYFQCFYLIFWITVSKILAHNFCTLPWKIVEIPSEAINNTNIHLYSDFILDSFQQVLGNFLSYKAFHIFSNYYFLLWLLINLITLFIFIKRKENNQLKSILILLWLIDIFCLISIRFYIYWHIYIDFFGLLWNDLFSSFIS